MEEISEVVVSVSDISHLGQWCMRFGCISVGQGDPPVEFGRYMFCIHAAPVFVCDRVCLVDGPIGALYFQVLNLASNPLSRNLAWKNCKQIQQLVFFLSLIHFHTSGCTLWVTEISDNRDAVIRDLHENKTNATKTKSLINSAAEVEQNYFFIVQTRLFAKLQFFSSATFI